MSCFPLNLPDTAITPIEKGEQQSDRSSEQQELFLETLVHDARAPLRHIMVFTKLLEEDIEGARFDDAREHSQTIRKSAKRIRNLIDTLAAYALLEGEVTFEPVCMTEVVKAALDNLALKISDRGAVVHHQELPTVLGHTPQLIQLLQNLIDNGIKFSEADRPVVAISATSEDACTWRFEVRDNGIGVPEGRATAIFEPFKRLWGQDRYEGTGLGLAICKTIVDRHKGRIWCASKAGEGSRFLFTLEAAPT